MPQEFKVWIIDPYTDIENTTINGRNKINQLYKFVETKLGRENTYLAEDNITGNIMIMFPLDNSRNMEQIYQLLQNEFTNILTELNTNGTQDIIHEDDVSTHQYYNLIREGINEILKPEEICIPDDRETGQTIDEWIQYHILNNYKCREFTPEEVHKDFKMKRNYGIKVSKPTISKVMKKMHHNGKIDSIDTKEQRYFLEID